MPKPKTLRPSTTLTIGEQNWEMKPTLAAMEAIERNCDAGFSTLFRRLRNEDYRFSDIAMIVHEATKAAGKAIPYPEAFELAQAHPSDTATAALMFVASAFGPPPEGAAANPPPAA